MLLSLRQPAVALAGILASILFPFRAAAAPEFDFDDNCMAPRNSVALTVQSSLFPSLPGQAVTLTAFVEPIFTADTAPGTADPSGTVQLSDGLTDLGTFNLRLGQVSTTIVFNDAGAHSIFATYSGDPSYCGASVRFGQQVDRFVTTLNLTSSAPASAFGQAVTFTARLGPPAPAGVVGPTGQVQFFDGSTPIGTVTPVAASATLTVAGLGARSPP